MKRLLLLITSVMCVVAVAPTSAHADFNPFYPDKTSDADVREYAGWYLPLGVVLGLPVSSRGVLDDRDLDPLIGIETSLVRLGAFGPKVRQAGWLGVYADALWDFGTDSGRVSIGPELGWGIVGIDGGYASLWADGTQHHGVAMRATFGVPGALGYVRRDAFQGGHRVWEIGLLLKFPIPLTGEL